MRIYSLLFCLFFALPLAAQEEPAKETYFERTPQGLVRFYFDQNYFLVDKDCAFKAIERLSEFIVSKNVFNGEFKDFDHNGRIILTGYHDQGLKQGLFTSYHPNGALKWTITFKDNHPIGEAKYFYPDSKPMLVVQFQEKNMLIMSYWDQLGRQRVINGNGNYAFKMPIVFYSEYGYPFFERRGKLKNGLPNGYWVTNFLDDKNRAVLYTEEQYNANGSLVDGFNLFMDESYNNPIAIIPTEAFPTAENLTFKQCNFDDFSGFNSYLREKLEDAFSLLAEQPSMTGDFSYTVSLSKEGTPSKLKIVEKLSDEKLNKYLESILKEVPFYFPSLNNEGEAMEDSLLISGKIGIDNTNNYNFHSIVINRAKQP